MKNKILRELKKLERSENIKIIFAIESGSRAWQFASKDSDYDVRGIHLQRIKNYLGFNQKIQINKKIEELDIETWDIRKFINLMFKSNPQIAEWLRSPIIYLNKKNIMQEFKKYFDNNANLSALRKHYFSMAKSNYKKYMGFGMSHSCKKWLYVLRAIACEIYIEKNNKLPPLPYKKVIKNLPKDIQNFFEKCVDIKNKTENKKTIASKKVVNFTENYFKKEIKAERQKFKQKDELESFMINKILKNEK